MSSTVFVLITDYSYFSRAAVTINDLRTVGKWSEEIVLITIDFILDETYKRTNSITECKFPQIDKEYLLKQIGPDGFKDSDKREINKLNQWEKFHVFDNYFSRWSKVVYLDAGLRVLDDVKYLLELDCKDKILAPIDGKQLVKEPNAIFKYQIDHENKEKIDIIKKDFGERIFNESHMLNCMWVYDTNILKICNKQQLINAMNTYTVCRTNEMGIMNLLFHFKYGLWEKFPALATNGKYLFEWCELNNNFHTTWKNYCFIKYPVTLRLNEIPEYLL